MNAPDADARPAGHLDKAEVVLAARNVSKSFGAVHALKAVNFDVHRGQVTTLFGENGAGKSTRIKTLVGDLTLQGGSRVEGENLKVGYFAQHQLEALDLELVLDCLQQVG